MRRVLPGVTLLVAMALIAPPVSASNVVYSHRETVTGLAEVYVSDCPWDAPPPDLAICTDALVQYFQIGHPGQPAQRQPWIVFVYQRQGRFHAEIDDFELLWERRGESADVQGYLDSQHLSGAGVLGSVAMSDGSTVDLDLTWDMTGQPIVVDGIDGPIEDGSPWGGTYADRCITESFLAHQRWRGDGQITGTIGETDVSEVFLSPRSPFIEGQSVFNVAIVQHAPTCLGS